MKLNLDKRFSPSHVLDMFPETKEDEQVLKDFLGFIGSENLIMCIQIRPIDGGICIWMD